MLPLSNSYSSRKTSPTKTLDIGVVVFLRSVGFRGRLERGGAPLRFPSSRRDQERRETEEGTEGEIK